jgi:hypothetical protein
MFFERDSYKNGYSLKRPNMKITILDKDGLKVAHLNRRKAIKARCLDCSGWSFDEVKDCGFQGCPLYPFRLSKGPQNPKERIKAVKDYCSWCMAGKSRK